MSMTENERVQAILDIARKRHLASQAAAVAAEPAKSIAVSSENLGPFWSGLGRANVTPVGIVGLGSSTMAGVGADSADGRWFNQLAAHLRTAFPNGATESPVGTLSTARVTTPGLHFYNGGISGARTTNYLPDSAITQIVNIRPRAVMHLIGSNDVMDPLPAEQYRANMISNLDRLDAAAPVPYTNVLIQAHPREGSSESLFGQYRQVLRELALTRPNCVMIDTETPFRRAGLPLPDQFVLLGSDTTHLTQAGHDMMFFIVAAGLGVPVTGASGGTAPAPATAEPQRIALFTDAFSGTQEALIAGRPVDNALGGNKAATWAYDGGAGEIVITNQTLTRPLSGGNWIAGIQMTVPDYEWSFRIRQMHTSSGLYIVARRSAATLAGPPDDYRLTMETTGGLQLRKRVAGTVSLVGGSSGTAAVGDRVGLRVVGDQISVLINGKVVSTATDTSLTAPGYIGLSGSGTVSGWIFDDLVASSVIA